jgi:hypothetical protein
MAQDCFLDPNGSDRPGNGMVRKIVLVPEAQPAAAPASA